jgi:hypothetical protein
MPSIKWVSPLRYDDMAEYRDEGFLQRLGVSERIGSPLSEFWPSRGPQWDALARTEDDRVLLVEAKANIPEIISGGTKATEPSLSLIQSSLQETMEYLHVSGKLDWSETFYQYANRLAHLYYLRVKNEIPAYLINVYFIGDRSVDGPQTVEEWKGAIQVMKALLGVGKRHKLSPYMADVFISSDEIEIP